MDISKRVGMIIFSAVLVVGMAVGFFVAKNWSSNALAETDSSKVDEETLKGLYDGFFGRPLDDGAKSHIGKDLRQVLKDLNNSPERRYYAALFKSVKAYEEAVRAPGDLSETDKQRYLDAIDSALSTLLAWVNTLPEQDICRAVVDYDKAREAMQAAYDTMSAKAKESAEHGVFNAVKRLGRPINLPAPLKRCLITSSPTQTPSATTTATPNQ